MSTLTSHQRAQRNYYNKNKDKLNATSKKWYEKNKDKVKDIRKKSYEKAKGTFRCDVCDKGLSSKASLNKHFKSIKHKRNLPDYDSNDQYVPVVKNDFRCMTCDKQYSSKYALGRHYKSKIHIARDTISV